MAAAAAAQNNSSSPSYETETQQPHDDFLEQMLSTLPNCSSWPDLPNSSSSNPNHHHNHHHHPNLNIGDEGFNNNNNEDDNNNNNNSNAAAAGSVKSFLLQQQMLLSRGGDTSGLIPLPLSLANDSVDSRLLLDHHHHQQHHHHDLMADAPSFKSPPPQGSSDGAAVQALFNSFAGTLHGNGQSSGANQQQQPFQSGGGISATGFGMNQTATGGNGATAGGGGGGGNGKANGSATAAAPPGRQRIRARRGQATDPHSIAERLRRERIAERMKALQELVPNANKTDKASMLDEIIDYVKFLQLQVKVLSMSRLGGAGAMGPLVADLTSEGGRGGGGGLGGGSQSDNGGSGSGTMEHQVAKMMEEDMGSAMQYLQGKGLCLMPISLATAISTATCGNNNTSARQPTMNLPPSSAQHHLFQQLRHASANNNNNNNGDGSTSPNLSALTVQSSSLANGSAAGVVDANTASLLKDSKP